MAFGDDHATEKPEQAYPLRGARDLCRRRAFWIAALYIGGTLCYKRIADI